MKDVGTKGLDGDTGRGQRVFYWLLLLAMAWGLIELTGWVGIHVLEKRGISVPRERRLILNEEQERIIRDFLSRKESFHKFSPTLGWTVKPNGKEDEGTCLCRANQQALRADREFAVSPPVGKIRLCTFGDSFTFGADVSNTDTWQEIAMRLDPHVEMLNFGVSAFGIDQAYLRYLEDGVKFKTHIAVMGFMSDDLNRSVSVFRPFVKSDTAAPFSKPRYIIEDGRLVLIPNPLRSENNYKGLIRYPRFVIPRIGKFDYFYRTQFYDGWFAFLPSQRLLRAARNIIVPPEPPSATNTKRGLLFNPASEAYRVTVAILDEFHRTALINGSLPLVVILPGIDDLRQFKAFGVTMYAELLKDLNARGIRYIDMVDFFRAASASGSERALFSDSLHYSPDGNAVVARALLGYLNTAGCQNEAAIAAEVKRQCGKLP